MIKGEWNFKQIFEGSFEELFVYAWKVMYQLLYLNLSASTYKIYWKVKLLQRKYRCDTQILSPEQRKTYQNYFHQTLDFSYKCGGSYLCNVHYFTRERFLSAISCIYACRPWRISANNNMKFNTGKLHFVVNVLKIYWYIALCGQVYGKR